MNHIIGLAAVDEVTGGKQMQQLTNGWMGWESKSGRLLRAIGARALVALAARLDATTLLARQDTAAVATPTNA
jgi:hypothetical protein